MDTTSRRCQSSNAGLVIVGGPITEYWCHVSGLGAGSGGTDYSKAEVEREMECWILDACAKSSGKEGAPTGLNSGVSALSSILDRLEPKSDPDF